MNDCNEILISIRSEYVTKILTGEKTVELRRRNLKVLPGTRVWIYSKGPHGAVKACAVIKDVVKAGPDCLWRRFRSHVGVTRGEFQTYFGTSGEGCALILENVVTLRKQITLCAMREKVPSFHPPQFYAKLNRQHPTLRALRKGITSASPRRLPSQR
jgi:predicted transcriptional regulator